MQWSFDIWAVIWYPWNEKKIRSKNAQKIRYFCGRIFLIGVQSNKLSQLWLLILIGHPHKSQPLSFAKWYGTWKLGVLWEKREELHANSYKTLGSYKGSPKTNFKDLKGKNGHSPMYSSTLGGKIQNLSWSFHAYQISAFLH